MAEEKKNEQVVNDETGYISVDDLREELAEEEKKKAKKECFFKRLFKKKDKEAK